MTVLYRRQDSCALNDQYLTTFLTPAFGTSRKRPNSLPFTTSPHARRPVCPPARGHGARPKLSPCRTASGRSGWRPATPLLDKRLENGMRALSADDYALAIQEFTFLIEAAPEYAEGWNKRATAHYLRGEYKASLRDAREALRREPRHFGALRGAGHYAPDAGRRRRGSALPHAPGAALSVPGPVYRTQLRTLRNGLEKAPDSPAPPKTFPHRILCGLGQIVVNFPDRAIALSQSPPVSCLFPVNKAGYLMVPPAAVTTRPFALKQFFFVLL